MYLQSYQHLNIQCIVGHAGGPGSIPGLCKVCFVWHEKSDMKIRKVLEAPGIDPGTSRMLSERSTIWATPPSMSWLLDIVKLLSGRQESKLVFKDKLITVNQNDDIYKLTVSHCTFDSSVGRAVDCSSTLSDIHRSLVQIRLEGFLTKILHQLNFPPQTWHMFYWMPPFCFWW